MKPTQGLHFASRLLLCASTWAALLVPLASRAQIAPASVDRATLDRYDQNHNGVLDADELARLEADRRAAVKAVDVAAARNDDVVSLSPFEVVSDTKGYYSANTMSGTRFNAKLEDLAAPMTVVTKEQMADFAMLDINDIFLYTAGAEGTGTYTDFTVNRNGDVTDNVQANPNQANRMRGLSSANISFNNFEMSGRMPIDPCITNGVEISRGPNANVFGLGQPGGTVNQIALMPNLTRNQVETGFRADSYGGYRTDLDLNEVLLRGKLGFRGTAVFQHDGFIRKPAGVDTERYNATLKFQPFKKTTITVGGYYFHQYGTRANFVNPRDSVSYWVQSGSPTWDPIDEVVHVNGRTLGPFTSDTNPGLPDALQRTFTGSNHNYLYIDRNGIGYLGAPNTFGLSAGVISPTTTNQSVRLFASNAAAGASGGRFSAQPLFITTPSVTNQALYDWTKINLAAMNYDWDTDFVSTAQLDQVFFNTPTQTLAAQVAFMSEDAQRFRRDHFGVANDNGQSGQLLVDVNEKMLDGSPNPYLGRIYIGQDQPRTTYQPLRWDTYRAQLAYKLDLTEEKGWLKWLGSHQLSGYDEYKYRVRQQYSYREAILDAHPWLGPNIQSRAVQTAVSGGPAAAPAITRSYLRYYVGDANTGRVNYAPGTMQPGVYPFVWGTYTLATRTVNGGNATLPTPNTGVFQQEPSLIGLAATTDNTGAGNNLKTILKTAGAVIQSHFLDDRIVTTLGRREDKQYSKFGSSPQQLYYPEGIAFNPDSINHWAGGDYTYNSGVTTQAGLVVRPFQHTAFVQNVQHQGSLGRWLGGALDGLFLTYNKSNSFQPQDPRISLYFQPLPNTTADSKDFGAGLNLFDGQLVLRWNRYRTQVHNFRGGDASVIAQRVTRMDVASNARFLLFTQMYSPTATPSANSTSTDIGWVRMSNPGFSEQQVQDEVARQMGLSWDTITRLQAAFNAQTIASTQDLIASGNEFEANYVSPSRNLTIAANATDEQSINANISHEIDQWIQQRMPIWQSIRDPRDGALWWTKSYGGSQTAAQNYDSFIRAPYSVVRQAEGKSNPQVRRYKWNVSTNYRLAGITENRVLRNVGVGGALRWESRGAIGYYGVQQPPVQVTDLDANNPIYDQAHLYVDLISSYRTKLWANRVGATFRLKVENVQESGRLQPIAAYPDGTPNTYRIVDPRRFILSATFDF
jgi:hypothetical protein